MHARPSVCMYCRYRIYTGAPGIPAEQKRCMYVCVCLCVYMCTCVCGYKLQDVHYECVCVCVCLCIFFLELIVGCFFPSPVDFKRVVFAQTPSSFGTISFTLNYRTTISLPDSR